MQRAQSCKPGHHTTEARKPAPGSRYKGNARWRPTASPLGPVPTSSLSPALPPGDNLEPLGWSRKLSATVLHTIVLKTFSSDLLRDSAL